MNTGYANPYVVSQASSSERAEFIKKTYLHLAGAIGVFILLEWILLVVLGPVIAPMVFQMTSSGFMWLAVLGLFMVAGFVADRWARSETSKTMQYAGLGLYIVAEAIIFLPLLFIAVYFVDPVSVQTGQPDFTLIAQAGLITGLLVLGLTVTAFTTKQDFSFLRGILTIGGFVAMGLIVSSIFFKFPLGNLFAGAMVVLMAVSILYTTSNIIHHYRTDQYVSASLALFAAIATLFWYVLRILISLASND